MDLFEEMESIVQDDASSFADSDSVSSDDEMEEVLGHTD